MTGAPRACACRCSSAESATGGAVARAAGPDGRRAGRGRLREAPAGGSGGGRGRPRGTRLRDLNENVTTRPPAATPSGPPLTPPTRGSRRDAVRRFGDPSLQIITVGDPVDRKSAVEVLVHEGRITGPAGSSPASASRTGAWMHGAPGERERDVDRELRVADVREGRDTKQPSRHGPARHAPNSPIATVSCPQHPVRPQGPSDDAAHPSAPKDAGLHPRTATGSEPRTAQARRPAGQPRGPPDDGASQPETGAPVVRRRPPQPVQSSAGVRRSPPAAVDPRARPAGAGPTTAAPHVPPASPESLLRPGPGGSADTGAARAEAVATDVRPGPRARRWRRPQRSADDRADPLLGSEVCGRPAEKRSEGRIRQFRIRPSDLQLHRRDDRI